MSIHVIGGAEIERLVTPAVALRLVDQAMRAVSRGEATHLIRRLLDLPGTGAILGDMPGSLGPGAPFGTKSVAIFPAPAGHRAAHYGFLVLFGPDGAPIAVLEAGAITALRTAAASTLATRTLARASARSLGILGAGEQARHHVRALLEAWPFTHVLVWARREQAAAALAEEAGVTAGVEVRAASVREVARCDVICTLTSATEPVLGGEWVLPGAHVNLVGSSSAGPREADSVLVARARYFVDSIESARAHASELLHAIAEGVVSGEHVRGEIGAVLSGAVAGRVTDADVTVYKALGHIAQDLALGWYVYQRALADGRGTTVTF